MKENKENTVVSRDGTLGVTTSTEFKESVIPHSFIIDIWKLRAALDMAETLSFDDIDDHVRIVLTDNARDGLLIQSVDFPKGSIRCACVEVIE